MNDEHTVVFYLNKMISKRLEIRALGYDEDDWREYETNEAQLRHLTRSRNLIIAELKKTS